MANLEEDSLAKAGGPSNSTASEFHSKATVKGFSLGMELMKPPFKTTALFI